MTKRIFLSMLTVLATASCGGSDVFTINDTETTAPSQAAYSDDLDQQDQSIAESGLTVSSVERLSNDEYSYEVLVYSGTEDFDDLLRQQRTISDGALPGLHRLWFDELLCGSQASEPTDLPQRSLVEFRRSNAVLFSDPPVLLATEPVNVTC